MRLYWIKLSNGNIEIAELTFFKGYSCIYKGPTKRPCLTLLANNVKSLM